MSDAWVAFGAALGGALAGGVVSTAGALWLQRHQGTSQLRRELFDDHVQRLIKRLEACKEQNENEQFWLASEITADVDGAMGRSALLASQRDAGWVREIREELVPASALEDRLNELGKHDQRDPEYQDAVEKQKPIAAAAIKKARQYEEWLRGKLG